MSEQKDNNLCGFDEAWIGKCKNGIDCEKHKDAKCVSCGAKATKECAETMGLVCGALLCDECEHTTQSNGSKSCGELPKGFKAHCKSSEQVFKPWYYDGAEEFNKNNLFK